MMGGDNPPIKSSPSPNWNSLSIEILERVRKRISPWLDDENVEIKFQGVNKRMERRRVKRERRERVLENKKGKKVDGGRWRWEEKDENEEKGETGKERTERERENSEKKERRLERRLKERAWKERGGGVWRKKRKFYFNESLAEGWKRQGQTEEIHSRINTRGCDSSFLLLLFPLWFPSPLSLSVFRSKTHPFPLLSYPKWLVERRQCRIDFIKSPNTSD